MSTLVEDDARPVRLCVVTRKVCWQNHLGQWLAQGGFPAQMAAIGSLFQEMTLVIVRGAPRSGGTLLPPSASVVPLRSPTGSGTGRKISVLKHLPYYVRHIARAARGADVVHTPVPGDLCLLGMFVAMALRKRLLVRYCGSWSVTPQTTLMSRVTRQCMRAFAGGRNVMLATGVGEAPPSPGISWVFATSVTRQELDLIDPQLERGLSNPPSLIYAGRLSSEKGVANLVKAVALLARDGLTPLPSIMLAGDGPERQELERLVQEVGCGDAIAFAGQLDRAALSTRFQQADVCVQPSLSEGLSKTWLDAFLHGVPVLTSDVGAAHAVIGSDGERGWRVPAGDVRALSGALRRVLTQRIDWPALRERCRAYVEGRTLETWAEEIKERCAEQWGNAFLDGTVDR